MFDGYDDDDDDRELDEERDVEEERPVKGDRKKHDRGMKVLIVLSPNRVGKRRSTSRR